MPVVLDNDAGDRVLLYGANGSTLLKLATDANGNLVVVGSGAGGGMVVSQTTPADLAPGIYAYTGAAWHYVFCDATGRLVVEIGAASTTLTIAQTNPVSLNPGIMAYDGATWRRQGLIWSYNAGWGESLDVAAAAAGTVTVSTAAVPAGSVYVLEALHLQDNTSGITASVVQVNKSGVGIDIVATAAVALNTPVIWSGRIALAPGDNVQFSLFGVTLNDVLQIRAGGYKMKIAM